MTKFYDTLEPVQPKPEFGSSGPPGWSFVLWCEDMGDEDDLHRTVLERFAAAHPGTALTLPEYYPQEDCIEGSLIWRGQPVSIWYESILNYMSFWSSDREAIETLCEALLPFAPFRNEGEEGVAVTK